METTFKTNTLPKQTWRILGLTAVLLLIITVAAIGFISAGFFDPKPVGELTAELPLQPITVEANQQTFTWLDYDLTAESYTLRLTAAHQSGDPDSGYGLAIGNAQKTLLIALSPTGYAAIQTHQLNPTQIKNSSQDDLDNMIANRPSDNASTKTTTSIFEWQPWPHVKTGNQTNEIWLDKHGRTITIYINRELLYTGPLTLSTPQIALYTATYNQPITINFEKLTIFSE